MSLGDLGVCVELAESLCSEQKWLVCGELAQQQGDLTTARICLLHAKDHAGLLLQATAAGRSLHRQINDPLASMSVPRNKLVLLI